MSSLTCYFGVKLVPQQPLTPVIPPASTLVITNICVSQETPFGGPATLYAQCANIPHKVALCTVHPDQGIFHWSTEMMFSKPVTFQLVPFGAGSKDRPLPSIHLTGYYECDEEAAEDQDDSDDSEGDE